MIGNIATVVGFLSLVIVCCMNRFDTATQLVGVLL
jgi:hypothetical protein